MKAATRVLALLMAVAASPASVGASDDSATAAEQRRSNWVTEGLLDPAAPAAHRAEIANKLETLANEGNDPHALYVAGSLYRLGRENSPTSPFPRNADKAREYLTRAALQGQLRAMGKLALFEHDEGNRFEANVWAQLLASYSAEFARDRGQDNESKPSVAATSVLALVQEGFPENEVPRLEERVGRMIRSHDKAIRAGAESIREARLRSPLRNARTRICRHLEGQLQTSRVRRTAYFAGGAEFYVSFADDGSAARVWLLDVWPDMRMERGLRACASRYRVEATEAIAGKGLVALVPISLGDPRVKLRNAED